MFAELGITEQEWQQMPNFMTSTRCFTSFAFAIITSLLSVLSTGVSAQIRVPVPSKNPDYDQGMALLRQESYEEALKGFEKAAALEPKNFLAHYYTGLCLFRLRRYQEALEAYQQALKLNPKDAITHYEIGKLYLALGDEGRAKEKEDLLGRTDPALALDLLMVITSKPDLDFLSGLKALRQKEPSRDKAGSQDKAQTVRVDKAGVSKPVVTYKERANYTEAARRNGIRGSVILSVIFKKDGSLQILRVVQALPGGLTRMALKAAQVIRFEPATRDGQPVDCRGINQNRRRDKRV